jgi:hypothetical protein
LRNPEVIFGEPKGSAEHSLINADLGYNYHIIRWYVIYQYHITIIGHITYIIYATATKNIEHL